jgi:ribosomal protein S18 acetylase RimI-like enzyme
VPQNTVTFEPVTVSDGEALANLRVAAMQDSLEAIGRFNEARAKVRFLESFSVEVTRQIRVDGNRAGFMVVKKQEDHLLLDHLYLLPEFQNNGIGSTAIKEVLVFAAKAQLPVIVGALKQSRSNDFYQKHGFNHVRTEEWDVYYQHPTPKPLSIVNVLQSLKVSWSIHSSSRYSLINPALGQCAVSALVINDLFGGELVKVELPEGRHFYNRLAGEKVDVTESQFIEPSLPYQEQKVTLEEVQSDCTPEQYFALKAAVVSNLQLC